MAAHRYWRLTITSLSAGSSPLLGELELRTTAAGANLPVSVGGTASASNVSYNSASAGINGDQNSVWGYAYEGAWLKWDFGVGNAQVVEHVTLKNGDLGGIARVTGGIIAWSDDDSSWTDLMVVAGSGTVSGVTATQYIQPEILTAALNGFVGTVSGRFGGFATMDSPSTATAGGFGGDNGSCTAPLPRVLGMGHDATGENSFDHTASSPSLAAYGGATARLTAAKPTLTATGTFPVTGSAVLVGPSATVAGAGTTTMLVSAALIAPTPSLVGYSGAVCSIALTSGQTISASGVTGGVGSAKLVLPLFELSATGSAQIYGRADLLAPSPQLGATAQAWLIAPGATLTAIGTAVVTVTREAYALNLKHDPRGGEVTDELTHFTNYPFDKIIRYQNSYYGVNSSGLYLLEGTTDAGTPIPWNFKTHKSDLGSPQKKTIISAYFGGRLGATATVTLHVGESGSEAYSYASPRGASAQNYRQVFGRGVKSRYYALEASGSTELTIDSINLNVALSTRKV